MLALLFQEYGLLVVPRPSFWMVQGPNSNRRPVEEEHPEREKERGREGERMGEIMGEKKKVRL